MADTFTPLTHEQLMKLRLGAVGTGTLYRMTGDTTFVEIGATELQYAPLLRASASMYQVLSAVQLVLVTFLETADIIQEHTISRQLESITSSVDLVLKFARNET
jgi:hypothetical protein